MKQKGFAHILLLLLITLIGIGTIGYFAYKNGQVKKIKIDGGGISVFSPSPTIPSSNNLKTANWKIYKNDKYGFEFKYPGSMTVEENDLKDLKDYLLILTISNPNHFGREGTPEEISIITVSIQKLPTEESLYDYILSKQYFPINGERIKIFKEIKPYEINGLKGYYYFGGFEYMGTNIFFTKNNLVYQFRLNDSEAGQYEEPAKTEPDLLDQILSTFQFLD